MKDVLGMLAAANAVAPLTQTLDRLGGGVALPRASFAPPPREPPRDPTPDLIAATLAAGMIAAGGKPVTAEEAVGVFREVRAALAVPGLKSC